jgi:hypothetical protein
LSLDASTDVPAIENEATAGNFVPPIGNGT